MLYLAFCEKISGTPLFVSCRLFNIYRSDIAVGRAFDTTHNHTVSDFNNSEAWAVYLDFYSFLL